MSRLLIIACSEKKLPAKGQLPAIERYDGPAFRVLRKYLREMAPPALTVLILSARYGLIPSDRPIPDYDCRISPGSARKMRARVLETLRDALSGQRWNAVGICAGHDYRAALDGLSELLPAGARIDVLAGGLGPRLTALRNWLLEV